jgi:hypothetical protein
MDKPLINKQPLEDFVVSVFDANKIPLTSADINDLVQMCEDNMIDAMTDTLDQFIQENYDD